MIYYIDNYIIHIDGHESKPATCILAIIEESKKIPIFFILTLISFMIKHNVV